MTELRISYRGFLNVGREQRGSYSAGQLGSLKGLAGFGQWTVYVMRVFEEKGEGRYSPGTEASTPLSFTLLPGACILF